MKLFRLLLPIISLLMLAACAGSPGAATPTASAPAAAPTAPAPKKLTVYAAASLTEAFQEIGKRFEAVNSGVKVEFNFAGSQDLRTQIEQGAHVDVFASADAKNMDTLRSGNLLVSAPQVLARNRLVVIVPTANPAKIQSLKDLGRPGLKLVIADASVPVGNYTLQMLDKTANDEMYGGDFKGQVLKNVVSKENNVKAVASKVALGEADAGVVYTTDARSAASQLTTVDVPDDFNVIAAYPIALLKDSPEPALAQQFIGYVLSPDGQAILAKYGFAPPG